MPAEHPYRRNTDSPRRRYETRGHIRYLTCSCHDRLPLFKTNAIKDAFVEHLDATRHALGARLFAFVVMPEHFHLLVAPNLPEHPVPEFLSRLKRPFARRMIARWSELDAPILERITTPRGTRHFWQRGGGYDRNIFTTDELEEKINYIHENPVRRGLVESAADYRWSSAQWWQGRDDAIITMDRLNL